MPTTFSKSRSPSTWEKAWQKELDATYIRTPIVQLQAAGRATSQLVSSILTNASVSVFTTNHRALCKLQHDLLAFAAQKCVVDDFEDKWRAAGSKEREKHYFEAMKRVCGIPDMERQRRFAPEISLHRFQTGNGQGYLDLLRSLMPEQILPNQYVRIAHGAVDAHFGIRGPFDTVFAVPIDPQVFSQKMLDLYRSLFMSLSVWHTLLSFYNLSEDTINVRSESRSNFKLTPDKVDELESKGISREAIYAIEREHKQAQKQGQWLCAYCRQSETQTTKGKFKSCSKCKAIKRDVRYCGRDCQINDWKNGDPPHKTICGKLTHDIPASPQPPPSTTTTSSRVIPPPAPIYRRSVALLHQISLLTKNPSVDYFLIPPAPLPDVGATLGDTDLGKLFRIIRNHAFETGNKEAVGLMCKLLGPLATTRTEFGLNRLEKQLGAEFGMDIKELREEVLLVDEDFAQLRKSL